MSTTETTEQPVSLPDEPDTEGPQLSIFDEKALRMAILSPLGQAIEGRPFGHPARAAERPPVWVDQLSRPGLDYDPGCITQLPEYETHAAEVNEVVGALKAMQGFLTDVVTAREKVKKDPTLTQAAMALAVSDYADRKMTPATLKVDAALGAINKRITEAEAKLRDGIPGHANGSMATEVRAHVKAMASIPERMKFMRELIATGDTESVAAVLKAKPFLSGLSRPEVDVLLHQYNLTVQPDLLPRIDFMKKAREHLERASAPFILDAQRAVGVKSETVKRLRDATAAAKLN